MSLKPLDPSQNGVTVAYGGCETCGETGSLSGMNRFNIDQLRNPAGTPLETRLPMYVTRRLCAGMLSERADNRPQSWGFNFSLSPGHANAVRGSPASTNLVILLQRDEIQHPLLWCQSTTGFLFLPPKGGQVVGIRIHVVRWRARWLIHRVMNDGCNDA